MTVMDEDALARIRGRAGVVWAFRARAERDARAQFARLAAALASARAGAAIVEMAASAARDEARHADLCEGLALHFGANVVRETPAELNPIGPAALGPRERALYAATAISCITETLSAAVLGELRERAEDPLVRTTVAEVLRDEVQHSRLGWAHLAAENAHGFTAFLGQHLPAMLSVTVSEELFQPGDDLKTDEDDALARHGALGRLDRREIFVSTLRSVIVPGFARFGVNPAPGLRWLDERLAAPDLANVR